MTVTPALQPQRLAQPSRPLLVQIGLLARRLGKLHRSDTLAVWGGLFLALIIFGAVFAPILTPYSPTKPDIKARFQLPSLAHPFGTDDFGRDLLARVLYGGRPILFTGAASVIVATLLGLLIGTASGYLGGRVDNLLMRLMDVMLSFPAVLLAILIVAALGVGLTNAIIAIVFSLIPVMARLVRSVVISLNREQYVLAARSLGAGDWQIVTRHLLPNMLPLVIVQATTLLAIAIGISSALNFLGLGVEPPTPDWGLMVSDAQRLIFDAFHVVFFPGLAITLTVVSVNYVGDALRDHLDPALRNRL
jgi:ABC-type dipeptide/oligopeptide/nickel transport system permease subunit